jgi:heme-degrading monooxygenase HmoA
MIANTPPAPYFAVIFTSIRTEFDHGYKDVAQLMLDLASKQPGYLGIESARNEVGITVSYWADLASIRHWKLQADHQIAQKKGITPASML